MMPRSWNMKFIRMYTYIYLYIISALIVMFIFIKEIGSVTH